MPTIKDALDIIGKLTVAEQESLKTMLLSPAFVKSLNIEDFVAKERFANGRVCPLCGCIHVVRNGHRKDGTQRYVCKDCGKSFVIATNSIVSGTRKDLSVWDKQRFFTDRKYLLDNKYIFKKPGKKNIYTLNVNLLFRGTMQKATELYEEQFGEELSQDSKVELSKIKKKITKLSKEDIRNLIEDLQKML